MLLAHVFGSLGICCLTYVLKEGGDAAISCDSERESESEIGGRGIMK